MPGRSHSDPEPAVLHEAAAARLLARASELDAARSNSFALADLRAAAAEAGISAPAFEAALAELREAESAHVAGVAAPPRRRRWRPALAAMGAALIALGALAMSREPAPRSVPTVEEAILLRCLSAEEAGMLVRPLVLDPWSSMRAKPGVRVLTVRTTPAQMERVKAAIEKHDGTGSPACAAPPPAAPTQPKR